jgi:hypothetical protein
MCKPTAVRFSSGSPIGNMDTTYFDYRVNGSRLSKKPAGQTTKRFQSGKIRGRNLRPLRDWFEVQRLRKGQGP